MSAGSADRPYLSVVAATRNDDHGGNPLYRTQLFVSGLVAQCDRHRVPAELVLVEWNPPADRPRLADVLDWPAGEGRCGIRIIEVPNELHARLDNADRLPLFQMIAKNVGIRRARGEFVLATNIDILFPDELMSWLARRPLHRGRFYTLDRHDVPAEIDPAWDMPAQLEFCRRSVIRINRREGTLDTRADRFYRIYRDRTPAAWLRNSGLGRRLCRSRAGAALGLPRLARGPATPPQRPRGELSRRLAHAAWAVYGTAEFVVLRVYALVYWLVAGFNDPRRVPERIRKRTRRTREALRGGGEAHDGSAVGGVAPSAAGSSAGGAGRVVLRALVHKALALRETWLLERARIPFHTNACGDFTLMAREDWELVGGYLELEMYSMHIDGLALYAAHYAGLREQFLPFPAYHIEHGGGFRPEAKGAEALGTTLERRAIPQITSLQLMDYLRQMHVARRPVSPNGDGWGLAREQLPETAVGASAGAVAARSA